MAFTFLKEDGCEIGASLYDEEGAKLVPQIKKKAAEKGVELILPVDFVCSSKFGDDGEIKMGDMETGVPEGFLGLDIGPKSVELILPVDFVYSSKFGEDGEIKMGDMET